MKAIAVSLVVFSFVASAESSYWKCVTPCTTQKGVTIHGTDFGGYPTSTYVHYSTDDFDIVRTAPNKDEAISKGKKACLSLYSKRVVHGSSYYKVYETKVWAFRPSCGEVSQGGDPNPPPVLDGDEWHSQQLATTFKVLPELVTVWQSWKSCKDLGAGWFVPSTDYLNSDTTDKNGNTVTVGYLVYQSPLKELLPKVEVQKTETLGFWTSFLKEDYDPCLKDHKSCPMDIYIASFLDEDKHGFPTNNGILVTSETDVEPERKFPTVCARKD